MNKLVLVRAFCLVLIFLGLGLPQAKALSFRGRILDKVSVSKGKRYSTIKVEFNFPVRYVRHFPLDYGKEVRIQLAPIAVSRDDLAGVLGRESLSPPSNNSAGVVQVEYEAVNLTKPTITVIFDKPTLYEAKQGEDFRSLTILVPLDQGAKLDETKALSEKVSSPSPINDGLKLQGQESLLEEGREVMAQKNYPRAIQIYTKLQKSPDPDVQEQAQFQLALAREYNGHLAHAKAEYKNYLRAYPEGTNAQQAHDRLKALLTARPIGSPGSRDSAVEGESIWQNNFFGSVSQYYDLNESFSDDDEEDDETVNFSILTTDVDATWRLYNDNYQIETLFIGSYAHDLLDERDDDTRISALYVDFEDSARTITSRWGRQSANSGGVLGRFDGGRFSYLLTDKVRLNLVAGFPVSRSSDGLETDKYFYGINFDLGRFADHWDFNVYFINQIADDIDDRRAIGGEVRYVGSHGSIFSLLDYDILYNKLNIALLSGNWLMPNNSTMLNFSADFRNSPVLTTSNALIGQTSPTLDALEDSVGESTLHQLAEDRTLSSSFVTLGISQPVTDKLQVAGDISWSKLDGGQASGGVDVIEPSGNSFYYSVQMIGSNLIKEGDISTIGLRYADTKWRDTYSLTLNTTFPVNDSWRINPKMQVDYRVNKELPGDQWRFTPSLRVEYRIRDRWRFEVEGGFSYANRELEGIAEDPREYFISMGIRFDF